MVSTKDIRALLTEFFGSFFIVFVTCWSFTAFRLGQIGYLALGLANGLVVAACVWAGVSTSGAQYNPIITIVKLAIRNMNFSKAALYILFQLLGSFLAALIVVLLVPYDFQQNIDTIIGYPKISILVSDFQAFLIEFILSMLYVFMYFATVVDKRAPSNIFGFALGAVITVGTVSVGSDTNACVNPARIFGPQLLTGLMETSWLYWSATIAGGLFAGFYYDFFLLKDIEFEDEDDDLREQKNMANTENMHQAMNLKY